MNGNQTPAWERFVVYGLGAALVFLGKWMMDDAVRR